MAFYASDDRTSELCAHRVVLQPNWKIGDILEWIEDADRPGWFRWGINREIYYVYLSDPDVAFEARMRFG